MTGYESYAHNQVQYSYDGLDEAFPDVPTGLQPFGTMVLFQLRKPKAKTQGGIILPDEVRATESDNTQIGKVIAIGPLCFRNPDTLEPWPEGDWIKPGDFVRIPKHGGDRLSFRDTDGVEVEFRIFAVRDLIAKVTGDPLAIKSYI